MRLLAAEIYEAHAAYLAAIRRFFTERGHLEVETPLLNRTGAVETHLDSLEVRRQGLRKSPEAPLAAPARAGYLITSPEYNMKILLSELRRSIFQIAHSFREGDVGQVHSEEFLMLEWYLVGQDEFGLMDECEQLVQYLSTCDFSRKRLTPAPFPRHRVSELLRHYADCPDFSRAALVGALARHGLLGTNDAASLAYDDLFFMLFLNRVEEHLGKAGPEFVYDYPPELAALSRIEDGRARRFELYWDRVELANGYYELLDAAEQRARFATENERRKLAGKVQMPVDEALFRAMERGLPECSGMALGVDRLFMLLQDATALGEVSTFD